VCTEASLRRSPTCLHCCGITLSGSASWVGPSRRLRARHDTCLGLACGWMSSTSPGPMRGAFSDAMLSSFALPVARIPAGRLLARLSARHHVRGHIRAQINAGPLFAESISAGSLQGQDRRTIRPTNQFGECVLSSPMSTRRLHGLVRALSAMMNALRASMLAYQG
jgi:hypothetical protein